MTCAEFVELIADYLDDELSPADAERFLAHHHDCLACVRYLGQYRLTIEIIGRYGWQPTG